MKSTSRRLFLKSSAFALPFLAFGCTHFRARKQSADEFVRVCNGQFYLRGRPHFFVGTNLWYGCYLSDAKLNGGRARMTRELDRLQKIGVNNIRLLAGSETSPLAGAIPRGITKSPRKYDDDLLRGLDFCLAEMAKRDMRGILFASNYWQWSGGFGQFMRWATGDEIPDPDKPQIGRGDWSAFMKYSARLYTTPAANQFYLDYIADLISRRNSVNGRVYRDDPTIMTWELANEPRPAETAISAYCNWVDATARFIRASDPNHLICTGSEGIHGCLDREDVFITSHETSAIDYVTVHMWLKNWGWLKTPELSPEFEVAAARAHDHVELHTAIATQILKKPLVLEEFGLPRDQENYSSSSPTTARDEYYRRIFNQVIESCRTGRALQGANFWAWSGEGRATSQMNSAAGLLGDPFSEPQGLNSVFDTDSNTLAVIANANGQLAVI